MVYILHIPKFEEKVHDCLLSENFESFLPLCWAVRKLINRKKQIKGPLFLNCIFVNIELKRISEVSKTPKILRCISFSRIPT